MRHSIFKNMHTLGSALKPKGQLIIHDNVEVEVDAMPGKNSLSKKEVDHLSTTLSSKIGHVFQQLPIFYINPTAFEDVIIEDGAVESLVNRIMPILESHTPQRFIATANALHHLGIKNGGGLLKGREVVVKDRDNVKKCIVPILKEKKWLEDHLPSFVKEASHIQKTILQTMSKDADVAPLKGDDSTHILMPKHGDDANYIVYTITKSKKMTF